MTDTRLAKRARYEPVGGGTNSGIGARPADCKYVAANTTRATASTATHVNATDAMSPIFLPSLHPSTARLGSDLVRGAADTAASPRDSLVYTVAGDGTGDGGNSGAVASDVACDMARVLPCDLEDHIVDFLSFGVSFVLHGLYKGAGVYVDRLWGRKQHLRSLYDSCGTLTTGHAMRLWDAVNRCPVLHTIAMPSDEDDGEALFYPLLCAHSRHLEVLELVDEPEKTPLFVGHLQQCARLHTLRLGYDISPEQSRWLAAVLPQSCRELRRLTWGGKGRLSTTGAMLEQMADAGVRLDELVLPAPCDARLLPVLARHPLRVLDVTLAGAGQSLEGELVADAAYVRGALPAALRALQSTLTRLCVAYEEEAVEYIAIPLWVGLERLEAHGRLRFTAPLTPGVPTLRNLRLEAGADCEWDTALLPSLRRVYSVAVFGVATATFAAAVHDAATAPTAEHVGFLPGLRRLECAGPVPLSKVLQLWPQLVVLVAFFADVEALKVDEREAPLVHSRLSELTAPLLQPIMRAWRFPNLRSLDSAIEDVDDWWSTLRTCMTAAASTLAVLKVRRSGYLRELQEVKEADPPTRFDWPVAFPRLTTAKFNLSLERHLSEIAAILVRAPALEHLSVALTGHSGLMWLSTLGGRGDPDGPFAALRQLHCSTQVPREALVRDDLLAYESLMQTAPLLRDCSHLAAFVPR